MQHEFEIDVAASPEDVWRALTDPTRTERYYYGCRFESDLTPGSRFAYKAPAGVAEEGTVVAATPPARLELRSKFLFDPRTKDDPPHRTTWTIEPLGATTRVRLVLSDFGGATASSLLAQQGMPPVLGGLGNLLAPSALARRLETIGTVSIEELSRERLDDYLGFFDERAFADNPAWAHCYCTTFHRADEEVHSKEENRAYAGELVAKGHLQGLLAYVDGKVAGWCNAAPRTSLVGFARTPHLAVPDPERVGSIACFVVAAPYRKHGVARRLLDGALQKFTALNLAVAEAYPPKNATSDASSFRGPLRLYEEAGFTVHKDAGRSWIVRKALHV